MRRVLLSVLSVTACVMSTLGCTSAIVGSARSASGATLLWKHRDTGAKANYVMRHEATDSTLEYIALHNDTDTLGLEAWIGMNRAGFAVMNTASYNLAPDTATVKDREGLVMTEALERCRTVGDFARLLDMLPRPLGVQANFGVIDASGAAAYFETCDGGYTRYDADPAQVVVRTNYSHSGGNDRRLGLTRERTAIRCLQPLGRISAEHIIDSVSRPYIDPATGLKVAVPDPTLFKKGEYIPRPTSTASIVIEAVPSEAGDGSNYVMWTTLGFPPTADLYCIKFD
ncbi:MAG: C45 family peptidase [Muribaculaceae bacterium]|nr:C45 family peptidase [Muribaculaceae bacterium]